MEPIANQLEENQAAWADDELQESIRMQAAELAQLHVDGAQAQKLMQVSETAQGEEVMQVVEGVQAVKVMQVAEVVLAEVMEVADEWVLVKEVAIWVGMCRGEK